MAKARKASAGTPIEEDAQESVVENNALESVVEKPESPEVKEPVKASGPKKFRVQNTALSGKSVYSVSGVPCVFDSDGIAEVNAADYAHLTKVPGYVGV